MNPVIEKRVTLWMCALSDASTRVRSQVAIAFTGCREGRPGPHALLREKMSAHVHPPI